MKCAWCYSYAPYESLYRAQYSSDAVLLHDQQDKYDSCLEQYEDWRWFKHGERPKVTGRKKRRCEPKKHHQKNHKRKRKKRRNRS